MAAAAFRMLSGDMPAVAQEPITSGWRPPPVIRDSTAALIAPLRRPAALVTLEPSVTSLQEATPIVCDHETLQLRRAVRHQPQVGVQQRRRVRVRHQAQTVIRGTQVPWTFRIPRRPVRSRKANAAADNRKRPPVTASQCHRQPEAARGHRVSPPRPDMCPSSARRKVDGPDRGGVAGDVGLLGRPQS